MTLDPAVAAVRAGVRRTVAALPSAGASRDGAPPVVVVACSGGADSLALLAATVVETRRRGEPPTHLVVGAVVDHGLQEGSAEHTAAVVAQMASLGADETLSARVVVEGDGRGPEAAARAARYAVLGEVAARTEAVAVLLGHTLDDQAETVLMGLTRGSGGRSVAGMRRSFDLFERPLLDVTRAQTRAACEAEGIRWWDDPHNSDPRFLRARVRERVMPLLETELGPGVAATLARTGEQLRPDMEALDDLAGQLLDAASEGTGRDRRLDVRVLRPQPVALTTRALRRAALDAGAPASELFAVHVDALCRLLVAGRGSEVQLPGHLSAVRERSESEDRLIFRRTAVPE